MKFIAIMCSLQGNIFVNGSSIEKQKVGASYLSNAGYVRQLAMPYYEELTVRENLILSATQRLPDSLSAVEKLQRVEQIIDEVRANFELEIKNLAGLLFFRLYFL